ncbi:CHAT domain-containing protein [Streptomyces rochei]|uniref:CHAT domain-containing protein n=1 Tax=Streptomyces TaxID=1883 RepID=UPI000F74BA3A|nr:CHAT domain-containing protein [Streptomyces sp. WAC06273]RSS63168.1 CHAT domain-containing protein [Streptomyces sp. WAC06273]
MDSVRLDELFPSAGVYLPAGAEVGARALAEPRSLLDVALLLRSLQLQMSGSVHSLEQFTYALLGDIQRLEASDREVPESARVALAMLVCWVPARRGFDYAQPLVMWRWLHSAFGPPVPADAGDAEIDLGPLDRALRDEEFGVVVRMALVMLAPVLFYLNNTAQSADHLAEQLSPAVFTLCRDDLVAGPEPRVDAASHLVTYLLRRQRLHEARVLGRELERSLFAHPDRSIAGALAVLLAGARPAITRRQPVSIARWALEHVQVNPYTALSLKTIMAAGMDVGERAGFFPEVIAQLETVTALVEEEQAAAQLSRDRGMVFSMSGPMLHALLQDGDHERLMQWLSVWHGIGVGEQRRDRCVVLAAGGSRAWYRPRTAVDCDGDGPLARLTAAFNAALGRSLITSGMTDAALTAPATGRVDGTHAAELEAALEAYLDIADLQRFARADSAEALVSLLPALVPVQALLARQRGPVLPLAVSLRRPLPDRPVRSVQLWCGAAPFTGAEADVLEKIFSYAGIRCDVVGPDEATGQNFLAAYQRDEYDVIWVAAHGRHPMLAPDDSAIVLSSNEQVPLEELAAASFPPVAGRRLLVLNTCDSAAANAQGPYDDFGLARSVAGPGQAVIGHLWPVPGGAAVVFGALLACELADGSGFGEAFGAALPALQDKWHDLARRFGDRGIGAQIAEALHDFLDPTLLEWGSPAFLE